MSPNFLLLSLSCLLLLFFSNSQTLPINIWPLPINISWPIPRVAPLSPSFAIFSPHSHPHLQSAVARYARLLRTENFRPVVPPAIDLSAPPLHSLSLTITDLSAPLQHGVDESYSLNITGECAILTSHTAWGAMRGLESFSQLAWGDPPVVATDISIHNDRPKFPHRGVMLDTSRNYYPVVDIMRTIAAMGANKLNVFHWHITDSHSFPIILPSEPGLAAEGSYGPGMQYTPLEVKKIVNFAMSYGVRVMPEIDTPGHTGSWAGAHPDIVTCANKFWLPNTADWDSRLAAEPGTGQLNPLNPKTYQVVRNVLRDLAALFPDSFLHSGSDEIIPGCWKSDSSIQSFLSDGGTLSQLLQRFITTTHPYITSTLNRTAIYWEDVLLDPTIHIEPASIPPSTTILQTWNNGPNNTKLIVAAGYRVIVSSADFYYLDCGHGDFVGNDSSYDDDIDSNSSSSGTGTNGGSWCGPFKTWQRVYDYDITYGLSEKEAELVLGGEVALWSEQADQTVLDAKLWPRASAMAEALWSGNRDESGRKRYAAATARLFDWRQRMVGRGIRAEPIQPLWCRARPRMCNLLH